MNNVADHNRDAARYEGQSVTPCGRGRPCWPCELNPGGLAAVFTVPWMVVALLSTVCFAPSAVAARFVTFVPLESSAPGADPDHVRQQLGGRWPVDADFDAQWQAYLQAWRDHRRDPSDGPTRERLGLPPQAAVEVRVADGTSSARSLARRLRVNWNRPLRLDSEHFVLLADVDQQAAEQVAGQLERFHAVWTQLFFPLWKDRQRWERSSQPPRRAADKMRVVLFRNPDQYAAALAAEGPAILQSTGYYSTSARTTFLRLANDDASAATRRDQAETRYHELTHQLLAEASDTRLKVMPGARGGFWLAEAIAGYMESTHLGDGSASVGGWQASRLQFARHRVLSSGDAIPLRQLQSLGRPQFQRADDLSRLYSLAIAYCHLIIDQDDGAGLVEMLGRLARLYQIRLDGPAGRQRGAVDPEEQELRDYLTLDDKRLTPLRHDDLTNLCLARCRLSPEALQRIAPQQHLRWLDLTGLPAASHDVRRLAPRSERLVQLSLEATQVDDRLNPWLARAARLEELDLSWTQLGDAALQALPGDLPLQTLWLTGSQVSDASLAKIAAMRQLQRVDLQRTGVSDAGRKRLGNQRPDLTIDPLELVPGS